MKLTTNNVIGLYKKYNDELIELENTVRGFLTPEFKPQFSDIEAELTYMLLREVKPDNVVEFSPCHGYSTVWILLALRKNNKGLLHSFDIINNCEEQIPEYLKDRFRFTQGDVKKNLHKFPKKIDYLFIDSDHSKEFCEWYIDTVFPLINNIYVSVHDVLKRHPSGKLVFGEAKHISRWCEENNIPYFGASTLYDISDIPIIDKNARPMIDQYKESHGFQTVNIFAKDKYQRNSAIFFKKEN